MNLLMENVTFQQKISDPTIDGYLILDGDGRIVDIKDAACLTLKDPSEPEAGIGGPLSAVLKDGHLPFFSELQSEDSAWIDLEGKSCLIEPLKESEWLVYTFRFSAVPNTKVNQAELLNELTTNFLMEDDIQQAWDDLFQRLAEVCKLDRCFYLEGDHTQLRYTGRWELPSGERKSLTDLGRIVLRTMKHVVVKDSKEIRLLPSQEIQSFICLPLSTASETIGVVFFASSFSRKFQESEIEWLEQLAANVSKMIERLKKIDQLAERNEANQKQNQKLLLERRNMSNILEGALDGIMLTDGKFRIIDMNDAGRELVGIRGRELDNFTLFDFVGEEEGQVLTRYSNELLNSGKVYGEIEILPLSGEGRILSFNGVKSINPNQNLIMFRDITRQKLTEKRLLEAKQEADKANRAKTDFLLQMSHEFRTPLNTIIGFSELLQERNQFDHQTKLRMGKIGEAGKELLRKINKILAETKAYYQSNDVSSQERLLLSPLMNKVFFAISPKAMERYLQFSISFMDFEGIVIRGTEMQVYQPLIEILEKVINSMLKGGFVKVQGERLDQSFRIEILFSGYAFSLKEMEWLDNHDHDPSFSSVDTGLILATRMIEEAEGEVTFHANVHKGDMLAITLPTA